MMKTVRFFAAYMARYFGVMLLAVAALTLCTRLFGVDSYFGTYLYIFPWLFCWLGNIALMALANAYAQLALSFGSTRRQVMAATAVCWLGGAAAGALLGKLCSSATLRFFPPSDNEFLQLFSSVPGWQWFLMGLFGGAVSAWTTLLPAQGAPWTLLRILANILVCVLYMLLVPLPMIAAQPGWGWTTRLPAALAVCSLPILALTLRGQRRLAVTT